MRGGLGVADVEGGHEVSDFGCHPLLTGFRRLFRAGSPRAPRSGAGCGSASGSRRAPRGGRGCWSVSRGPGGGSAGSRDGDVHPFSVAVLECSGVSWLRSYGVPFRALVGCHFPVRDHTQRALLGALRAAAFDTAAPRRSESASSSSRLRCKYG